MRYFAIALIVFLAVGSLFAESAAESAAEATAKLKKFLDDSDHVVGEFKEVKNYVKKLAELTLKYVEEGYRHGKNYETLAVVRYLYTHLADAANAVASLASKLVHKLLVDLVLPN